MSLKWFNPTNPCLAFSSISDKDLIVEQVGSGGNEAKIQFVDRLLRLFLPEGQHKIELSGSGLGHLPTGTLTQRCAEGLERAEQ